MASAGRSAITLALAAGLLLASSGPGHAEEAPEIMSPRIMGLQEKLRGAYSDSSTRLVSAFLEENAGQFPLIEDSLVTFVYNGTVGLRATVPSDMNRWDTKAQEMTRLGGTDLYYLSLAVPMDARIDYKFYVDRLWMLDPLNPRTITGGFGDNSEFSMPGYTQPPEIAEVFTAQRGTVDVHEYTSDILPSTRKIQVYVPFGSRPDTTGTAANRGPYPVVFVQDGGEYITLASMVNVLDNTIRRGRIPPIIAVFIDPVDRNYEYWLNADYERLLIEEIIPFIRVRYDVSTRPDDTAIMGASLGGAISFMIAMNHPEIFGMCGSQSGAFEVDNGRLLTRAEASPKQLVDFYLDCGRFGDLLSENRKMQAILTEKGYRIKYQEFNEGHSWGNWRAHIDDMLVFFWGRRGEK
jgi:enterochelin esterase-like enzyme